MLSKKNRLRKEKDIQTLFSRGKGVFDDVCGVKYRKNDLSTTRIAVIVGKKVSKKAVVRNRIQRRIREILRTDLDRIKSGFDIALLVQRQAVDFSEKELRKRIFDVLKKASLLKE